MKITIWSVLSGKVAGHIVMNIPPTQTIRKVLNTYCNYKGVSQIEGYVIRSRDNLVLNPHKTLKQARVQDGDTLTLGLIDDEQQTFAYGSWWIVMLASFIIGIIGLIIVSWIFFTPIQPQENYGIVIDAGSSHSEIFLFKWEGKAMGTGTPDVHLSHRCLIVGGITSFATHIDDLGRYFSKCIEEMSDKIAHKYHAMTPLYLGATAGMRILRKFDPKGADGIFMSIREYLARNTTFKVDVEILPGYQEGDSGWIAVNYLLNNFKKPGAKTAVTLDIGGASMQVTSELPSLTQSPTQLLTQSPTQSLIQSPTHFQHTNLTLFNHQYQIASRSFMCYGLHEASHRYNYLIVYENKTENTEINTENTEINRENAEINRGNTENTEINTENTEINRGNTEINPRSTEISPRNTVAIIDPCLARGVSKNLAISEISGPCTLTRNVKPNLSSLINVNLVKLRKIYQAFMNVGKIEGDNRDRKIEGTWVEDRKIDGGNKEKRDGGKIEGSVVEDGKIEEEENKKIEGENGKIEGDIKIEGSGVEDKKIEEEENRKIEEEDMDKKIEVSREEDRKIEEDNNRPNVNEKEKIEKDDNRPNMNENRKIEGDIEIEGDIKIEENGKIGEDYVKIEGSSDAHMCELKVKRLFDFKLCNSTFVFGDCFDGAIMTQINSSLVAFSGLFRHLNPLLHLDSEPTFDELQNVVFKVCSMDSNQLFAAFPGLDKSLAEDLCFDSMYIFSLLTAGLGITKDTWPHTLFTAQINDKEVVWPQGFMLNATSSMPPVASPQPPLAIATYSLLCILFVAFILSGFLFLHHSCKLHKNSMSYQRCDHHLA